MIEKLAISVSKMAEIMDVSRPTAYRILEQPDFDAAFRVGGRVLISRERLAAWIDRQCGAEK